MLSLNLMIFLYLYPVVRGLILHWSRSMFASILAKDNSNVFVRHVIPRRAKLMQIPTLYARAFSTADDHGNDYLSWYIDGIPFVIDNSVTAILSIQSRLFTGPLIPPSVTL